MYCSSCGVEISDSFRYCPQCGTTTKAAGFSSPVGHPERRLTRPREERRLAGVCAGIARYLEIDVTLVRVLMLIFAIFPPGAGLIIYLVCWIVMPQDRLLLAAPRPETQAPASA